jgi:hypothetical protein
MHVAADLAFIVAAIGNALPFVHRLALAATLTAIKAVSEGLIGRGLNQNPLMPEDFTKKLHSFILLIAVSALAAWVIHRVTLSCD